MKLRGILKTHGGKGRLSQFIIDHFPSNYEKLNYLELFCGGASVFMSKKPSVSELLNDKCEKTIAVLRTIRDHSNYFIKALSHFKYEEKVFAREILLEGLYEKEFDIAVNEFILRRMSRGGMKKTFAWSDRQRGGQPGDVNAWQTAISMIPEWSKRLKDTIITNLSFEQMTVWLEDSNTIIYQDPPYLHETRKSTKVYDHEMTEEQHIQLAEMNNVAKAKICLSGYDSQLYRTLYCNWNRYEKVVPNNASQGKVKRKMTEVLWTNY